MPGSGTLAATAVIVVASMGCRDSRGSERAGGADTATELMASVDMASFWSMVRAGAP